MMGVTSVDIMFLIDYIRDITVLIRTFNKKCSISFYTVRNNFIDTKGIRWN